METEVIETSKVKEKLVEVAERLASSEGQTPSQKREQLYALSVAAVYLDCLEVIEPIYLRVSLEDGVETSSAVGVN